MSNTQKDINFDTLQKVILQWLEDHLNGEAFDWVSSKSEELSGGVEDWLFFSSFSAVPRYTGKDPLSLSEDQLHKADELRKGWSPAHWSTDQLGRTLLVLSIANYDKKDFLEKLEKTFISSDMGEAEALYQALPVLPYPEELQDRAAEGIRSNITSVFNAVALRNPYPADFMNQDAFNQVVLKALFVGSPLYLIQNIDQRTNKKLADILVDYAHERWAADRTVSPELWRPVGPFAGESVIEDFKKVLADPDDLQQRAAVMALSASSDDEAKKLVKENTAIMHKINDENITWDNIGERSESYR